MTQFESLWRHLALYSSYKYLDFDLVSGKTTPFEQPHRLKLYGLHLRNMFDSEVIVVWVIKLRPPYWQQRDFICAFSSFICNWAASKQAISFPFRSTAAAAALSV